MKSNSFIQFATLLIVLAAAASSAPAQSDVATKSPTRLELGANVNESITRLDKNLLDRSRTKWVRGFLPATEFITGQRSLTNDVGIQTFQRCAREGRKVLVTIKWDFRKAGWRVPAPESQRERDCFAFADGVLDEMRGEISVLALINEVFEDTAEADLRPGANGRIAMVEFLERLTTHVAAREPRDPQGRPLPLFCGGFTRLDLPRMQTNTTALALMKWCESDPHIAGVNFHLHEDNFQQFEQALDFIRQHISTKPLAVTEFSLIWNYRAHLEDRLDVNASSADFAKKNGLAADATVRDFINRCMTHPVPEATWVEFVGTQRWFDADFLKHSCDLMESRGVIIATYAFSQHSSGGRAELPPGGAPWLLNPIYIPLVAVSANTNQIAVNRFWFDEYVRRQN